MWRPDQPRVPSVRESIAEAANMRVTGRRPPLVVVRMGLHDSKLFYKAKTSK